MWKDHGLKHTDYAAMCIPELYLPLPKGLWFWFVCLFVSRITEKLLAQFSWNLMSVATQYKLKGSTFQADPNHRAD